MHARAPRVRRVLTLAAAAAVVATVATLGATAGGAAAEQAAPRACATTAAFETDGYMNGESLNDWKRSGFNANPPAGWEIIPVPYYAGIFPIKDATALDESVAAGADILTRAVTDYHAACPQTRLVLAGFSEGAIVAGDTLAAFSRSTAIPHELLNGVLYGNPRRDFGDGGIGGIAGGIETNIPTILPGVTMRGGNTYGDIAVRDVCNENDGICNSANMITNLAAFANGLVGYANGDHGYDLNPARDLGSGLLLHHQPQRVPYGPPLQIPIGTPWQLQQQWGGNAGRAEAARARDGLAAFVGRDTLERLTASSPWYQLLDEA